MRTWMALLLCVAIGGGLGACGSDEPEAPETTPEADTPPGIDPDVVADYEAAPVPPPVAFGSSDIRSAAVHRGLFKDMPEAKPENLAALLETLAPARKKATANPGSNAGGPAGPSYMPSDAELVLAELGERISVAHRAADAATRAAARTKSGVQGSIDIPTFRITTAKVFGTGYVPTIEQLTMTIDLGS